MIFAHGIGGAQDLPLPVEFFVAGAGAALAVSFLVLILAWRRPRYDDVHRGRPVPSWVARPADSPALAWLLRGGGLALAGYVGFAALVGPDLLLNPTFGVFYVWLWIGIVPLSLLFGRFYRAVNPVRTLHLLLSRVVGGDPEAGLVALPSWVGLWPAAVGLYAFVWLELVHPENSYLGPVRLWLAGYVAVVLLGAAVFGSGWIARADPFEVYSTLVGRLSVLGRDPDGRLVVRSPLANLATTPPAPGLVAVVSVLLGSTAFDSFKEGPFWLQLTQASPVGTVLLDTAALTGFCLLVAGTFAAATVATGLGDGTARRQLPGLFAHSVVPIVVGYVVAHYLTLLVEEGQRTLALLSDPLARGDDLLGTADWPVSYWLSDHPSVLALVKVAAVVTGHVVAVVAAHDRAVRLLPPAHQVTGQLSLLTVMVGYTVAGLYLLFGG